MKHYLIYKTTCRTNGKIYVGMHETENIDDGYLGSGVLISRAIEKYGRESFDREILHECDSREEMVQKEIELVDEEFVLREDTYNCTIGGYDGGFWYIRKHKLNNKVDQWKLGQAALAELMLSEEYYENHCKKISCGVKKYLENNDHQWSGRSHSEETKRKIGAANSKHQSGSGNSQFGTCWIKNEQEQKNIRIPKDELNHWLSQGWQQGRKMKW